MNPNDWLSIASVAVWSGVSVSQFLLYRRYKKVLASNAELITAVKASCDMDAAVLESITAHRKDHEMSARYAPKPFWTSSN